MFGSVAAIAMAGLFAGCSGDVVRFDDGFYTGSVPQSVPAQQIPAAQPYPGQVDGMATGAIAPASPGGGYLSSPQPSAYPAGGQSMQRGQLPPPPEPSYRSQPAPVRSEPSYAVSAPQPVRSAQVSETREVATNAAVPASRGAPPTTLQQQASSLATPQPRPMQDSRSVAPTRSEKSAAAAGTVKVVSGDTLSGIARRSGVSADAIRRANNLDSDVVRLGQTLMIPAGGKVPAAKTQDVATATNAPTPGAASRDNSAKVADNRAKSQPNAAEKSGRIASAAPAVDPAPTGSVQKAAEREVAAVAPNSSGIDQFRWPVQGRVINRFGEKVDGRRNDGVNISVPRGTPIKAAENGVVIYAGDGLKEFGNTVLVKHDSGLITVYGHADKLAVKKGSEVRRGEVIAQSGMSGDADVPMLHFEVRKNSTPVDPTKYLQ
ncbi:peptidoglycan DD-metalloendopeptidase family protein [Jiella pelagia]|uniref:Peptidoglycan DD-metalloendopeptidase family protein n=1 Tax=Jiella pelagia TaxID=2986949 RepID=A0ABY7C5T5_9HYPH|nr:peptidoglycan DD-metalloendopeptidase family protein [Jiella pelagia]WAP69200.1 peptidoglycan DD-metalloendopeptidase family protein [Jiella pelagia]